MKKLSLWLTAGVTALALGFASCGGDEDDPTPTVISADSCATAVYPENTGDATVKILNFEDITQEIMVEAGSELALAVEVTRGANRAQKIKLYQSACENILGDEVDLSKQPKGNSNGIDLRRTDNAQVRDVVYTVPASGFSDIYLTVEVDEVDDLVVYTQLHLKVSGSGIVDEFTGKELGGNSNAKGSRLNASTGVVYTECDAADNIESIDVTYVISIEDSKFFSYICSNPARFESPIGLTNKFTTRTDCNDDEVALPTDGGNATYFAAVPNDFDYATATNTEIDALSVSAANDQFIQVSGANQVIAFMNSDGKKGVLKIEAVDQINLTAGFATVGVKIQR